MKLFSEFSGQIACKNRSETKPLPHNNRLSFFNICISLVCFRGSRRPLWTLFGAEQILVLTKKRNRTWFLVTLTDFYFFTPEKTDCPLVPLGPYQDKNFALRIALKTDWGELIAKYYSSKLSQQTNLYLQQYSCADKYFFTWTLE